jgi:hypothetical protein
VLFNAFGLYSRFVAGTLSKVQEINFYVLRNKKVKYSDYTEKCISGKQCTISFKSCKEGYFKLSSSEETVVVTLETRIMDRKLPSGQTFLNAVLNKIRLSSLAYGILSVHNHVTYITNEVPTSRHDCVLERYICDLYMPKRLLNCKLYTKYCSAHPYKKSFLHIVLYWEISPHVLGTSV